MIKQEIVKTTDRDIVVKEVRVRRILSILPFLQDDTKKDQGDDALQKSFGEHAEELLRECCGLTFAEFKDLYPSEIEAIWVAFKKVNSFFFQTVEKLGLGEQLKTVLRSVLDGCGEQLAISLSADIRDALTMALASSSMPPTGPLDSGEIL